MSQITFDAVTETETRSASISSFSNAIPACQTEVERHMQTARRMRSDAAHSLIQTLRSLFKAS